jgi:hypothetical protein
MRKVLLLYREWRAQKPRETALRAEAANVTSWLGTLAMQQGRLREAEGYFAEQVAALARNRRQEPQDVRWRKDQYSALSLLAEAQTRRGEWRLAQASLAEASALAQALARRDPDNRDWRASLAYAGLWQAELEATATPLDPARSQHARAVEAQLAAAQAAEPQEERLRTGLASARNLVARLALARGDTAAARSALQGAHTVLDPAWRAHQNENMRVVLANTLVLDGETAWAAGDASAAGSAWRHARALLLADAGGPLPFARLDPLVRALRHLGEESRAVAYRARLDAAGYVPLQAWPAGAAVAAR